MHHMTFAEGRPFADPEVAARKLLELANAFEPIQDAGSISRRSTSHFCSS